MGTDEGRIGSGIGEIGGWKASAGAWIASQGEYGDWSRQEILDPCLDQLLSKISGLDVLDVGCGEGRYARKMASRGAKVTGVDPVEEFIAHAARRDSRSTYLVAPGECLPFGGETFDLVLSYLSIIDIPDLGSASREMCRVLRPGGRIVLATISNLASTSDGWIKDEEGRKIYRTVDRYMEEFAMDLEWGGMRIRNFHRPLSAILAPFFGEGLVMDGFTEPLPEPGSANYQEEFRAPNFQILTLRK